MVRKFSQVWVAFAVLAIAACAQFNPIARAETSQQKALAAYGSVVILVEQAADLVAPGTLPDRVQRQLISLGETGSRVAGAGLVAYKEAENARLEFEANASSQGRLTAALTSLDQWTTQAASTIQDLKTALRGAQ